jgi:hypothetical protein
VLKATENELLTIESRTNVNIQFFIQNSGEAFIYQLVFLPLNKFDLEYIRMSPYSIIYKK